MTLGEFSKAKIDGGQYTVSVIDHKTDYDGPTNIVFEADLYYDTKSYIAYYRNALEGISTERSQKVFVGWMGNMMDSSLICTQLVSFWNKVQGKRGRYINSTIVRKYTTTTVHQNQPEDAVNLLCHSLNMAK